MQAVKEVDTLRAVVGNYEKDKTALAQSKGRLLQSEKHLKHLEWENEVHQLLVDLSQSYVCPRATCCATPSRQEAGTHKNI